MVTILLGSGREQVAPFVQTVRRARQNQPVAITETSKRHSDENRLIRREPSQIADPGAAYAKAEQQTRNDAARGGRNRRQNTASRSELLRAPRRRIDRYGRLGSGSSRYTHNFVRPLRAVWTSCIL
jgi:hypothetical protein